MRSGTGPRASSRRVWQGGRSGAARGPFRATRCGAFLVEPRDDMEEEAPELKNAVAIPLSDARGLRYALAERVRHSMAVKKFAVTNELDVNITLHWFDLEQEEGLRDHSPYKQVSFLEPGASTSLGTFVGHVFAVGDEEGRFLGQVTVRGIGDAAVINEALIAEAETCQEGSIPHDPHAAQGQRKEMQRFASLEGPEGRDARVRFAVGEKVRDLAFEKRKALSDVQIALTPNVTEDGFRLIRTPSKSSKLSSGSTTRATRPIKGKRTTAALCTTSIKLRRGTRLYPRTSSASSSTSCKRRWRPGRLPLLLSKVLLRMV